jgi:hypothetical protein
MSSITGLQSALSQLYAGNTGGGFDFSVLARGAAGATATYSAGGVKVAMENASKNEAKQLAQVAKDPTVQKELAHYEKVVKSAKSVDEVLNDPIARKVLMTANGLGAYVNQVALAKKALMSNPDDPNSMAARLASTNSAWLQFAQDYNLAKYGTDRLYDKQDGFLGKWTITIQRDGKPVETTLEIAKTVSEFGFDEDGVFGRTTTISAKIDGEIAPITINDGVVTMSILYEDAAEHLHITTLTGTLGKDGLSVTGAQKDDSNEVGTWKAVPFYANAIQEVRTNYIAEKRLDMLDAQLPGLGSAILFKEIASKLDTPIKILGSALGRDVVTTALGLPKQLALQSIQAQEKAIRQRMDPAKLKSAHFVEQLAQRYLIMRNGGTGGITA